VCWARGRNPDVAHRVICDRQVPRAAVSIGVDDRAVRDEKLARIQLLSDLIGQVGEEAVQGIETRDMVAPVEDDYFFASGSDQRFGGPSDRMN
jgi:hypothetical protein